MCPKATFAQCSRASKAAGACPDAQVEGRLCLRKRLSSFVKEYSSLFSAAVVDLVRMVQARPPKQQQQFLQTPVRATSHAHMLCNIEEQLLGVG